MSSNKKRRPTGRVLYVVFWVGAVLCGLGFLGNLPTIISGFLRNYPQNMAEAFSFLAGQLIVGAIAVLCILEIIDTHKARKRQDAGTKEETGGPSPVSIPTPSSVYENAGLLNTLKEKLFSLECEKLAGTLTPEEYTKKNAALETLLKQAQGASDSDSIPYTHTGSGIEQTLTEPKRGNVGITLRIAIVLVWTWFLVYARYRFTAEAVEFWIGTLLLPFLIAYAIAGAKQRRNWVRFSYWFLGLGILLSLNLTNQNSLTRLSHSDLLKELSGTKPLEENLPENQKEMAAVSRAIFADMRAFSDSQDAQIETLKPELGQLYTSESFSSKDTMQKAMDALNKALSLDRETESMLKRMPESVKARLDRSNLSDADKSSFMKNFLASFNSPEYVSARNQIMIAETDWVNSVNDLYSFSLQHFSEIIVSKDKIGITREATRSKFNQKLARAQDLHDNFLAATKKQDELREASFKKLGISSADMGLDK